MLLRGQPGPVCHVLRAGDSTNPNPLIGVTGKSCPGTAGLGWPVNCSELGEGTQRELQEMFGHLEAAREGSSSKIQGVKTSGVGSRHGGKAGEHEVLQGPQRITRPAVKMGD